MGLGCLGVPLPDLDQAEAEVGLGRLRTERQQRFQVLRRAGGITVILPRGGRLERCVRRPRRVDGVEAGERLDRGVGVAEFGQAEVAELQGTGVAGSSGKNAPVRCSGSARTRSAWR